MKKIICKKEYDTEIATVVKKCTFGNYGDPEGYEEILFQTPEGLYFVYGNGGANSPYPVESLQRIAKTKIKEWLQIHE